MLRLYGKGLVAEMFKEVDSMNEYGTWISCSERLPEKEGIYLVVADTGRYLANSSGSIHTVMGSALDDYRTVEIMRFSNYKGNGRWVLDGYVFDYVSHWMKLPELPKE